MDGRNRKGMRGMEWDESEGKKGRHGRYSWIKVNGHFGDDRKQKEEDAVSH